IVLAKLAGTLRTFLYDPSKSFRSWLRTVTKHALHDFRDARQRAVPTYGLILQDPQARTDLEQHLQTAFDHELLEIAQYRVQQRVEPVTWEAFRLTALQGLSGEEAAQRLGILRANIYVAKHRVQKLLQEEVLRMEQDPTDITFSYSDLRYYRKVWMLG